MAAHPTQWGTMSDRDDTSSARPRLRRETEERQRYCQPTPSAKKPAKAVPRCQAYLSAEAGTESFGFFEAFTFVDDLLGKKCATAEGVESELPPILAAIDALMSPSEDDGDPVATEHAYQSARAVVESAYGLLLAKEEPQAKKLPAPILTTDERGGIRVSWQHGDRYVRTSFASAEGLRSYLYFESPEEHDIEPLQPALLSTRLGWMLKA